MSNEPTNAATDGKRQNEPAFPNSLDRCEPYGITRLEYFAVAALTGLCANPNLVLPRTSRQLTIEEVAFDLAEAMCAESQRRAQ